MPTRLTAALLATTIITAAAPAAVSQQWTQFRGPNNTGIGVDAPGIPARFTEADYNWRVELPGIGHSSPVIWGDNVYITAYNERTRVWTLQCLAADSGSERWRQTYDFAPFAKHQFNSYASPSPTVDEHHVYIAWSVPERYTLAAFTHDGRKVWERDLGTFNTMHGSGASPRILGDLLILNFDQYTPARSALRAFNRMTGESVWSVDRDSNQVPYATPTVFQSNGQTQLLISSQAMGLAAYDPEDGHEIWRAADIWDKRSLNAPQLAAGLIIVSCGSGGGGNYMLAIRPPARPGDEPQIAYRLDRGASYVPTPIVVNDRLFLVNDGGIATCLEPATGRVIWQQRLGEDFFGSPVSVNGNIYAISRPGRLYVFRAADTFQPLATIDLGEESHSTPAIADGRMYLRTVGHLISVGRDGLSLR